MLKIFQQNYIVEFIYPTLVILFPRNSRHFNALLLLMYEQSNLAPSSPIYISERFILAAFLSYSSNDCNELDIFSNLKLYNYKLYHFLFKRLNIDSDSGKSSNKGMFSFYFFFSGGYLLLLVSLLNMARCLSFYYRDFYNTLMSAYNYSLWLISWSIYFSNCICLFSLYFKSFYNLSLRLVYSNN